MYGLSKSTDSLTLVNKGFMHVNLFYSTIDGKELKLFRDKLIYRKIKQKKNDILRYYAYLGINLSLKWG